MNSTLISGRSHATESARASLHYGFETLGLTRVIAIAAPENHASRRVMEKVGMLFERPAHHYGLDVVLYAVDRTAFSLNGSPYAVR
jgi:ribosomal-protein-alanine N-acetyltransferase